MSLPRGVAARWPRTAALSALLMAVACAPVPKLSTTLEVGLQHAQATGRHLDDMSFNVPSHSLMRCTRIATRLRADSDPSPDLDGAIDASLFGEGCTAARHDDDGRRVLDVIGLHVELAADGHVNRARILDRVGDVDPSLDSCLLTNVRRFHWPANRNGKPYEKHVFNVFALDALGETTWRMMDTVRRLSEPRRAVCACLRDVSPDIPVDVGVGFRLPASRVADVHAQAIVMRMDLPISMCLANALAAERFASSGLAVDVDYIYRFEPTDVAVEQAISDGSAGIPTDADDPIIAIRVGRSASVPPAGP